MSTPPSGAGAGAEVRHLPGVTPRGSTVHSPPTPLLSSPLPSVTHFPAPLARSPFPSFLPKCLPGLLNSPRAGFQHSTGQHLDDKENRKPIGRFPWACRLLAADVPLEIILFTPHTSQMGKPRLRKKYVVAQGHHQGQGWCGTSSLLTTRSVHFTGSLHVGLPRGRGSSGCGFRVQGSLHKMFPPRHPFSL